MKIQEIVMWLMFFLTLFIVGWYFFGDSPTFEQTILVLNLSLLISVFVKVNFLETRFQFFVRGFKKHLENHKLEVKNL